ncbi:diguanylate cyclase domain-containing protein [Lawsonibacter sp. LCP25S3_G6]|uniref:GGDEF domain-containing protein n=1 Tax=unclassified Lawsonibacter TaxID=2617946 RepID=UPI003F97FD42
MPKIRHDSFLISCFLSVLALAGFFVIFFFALRAPVCCQPELHPQLVQIKPVGPAEDGADTIYQKLLSDDRWGQPVCAVTAKRTPYSVYLDGVLLQEYIPGTFDHGGMIHWISLPNKELAGHVLKVSAPSEELTVLVGDYSDLILHYRNTNAATLIFSGLFLLLGILIGLLSLGASTAFGAKRLRTLRYLSALVLLVSLWISMDSAVLQMVHISGAIMYVLAMYAFMAMPLFMIQFYRSMMDKDSRLLRLIYWLHLLNLCICGLLQVLGVAQFHEMLPLTHILMIVTLLSLLRLLVSWLHSQFHREARLMLSGFGALGCCCAMGFLDYYLWGKRLYLIYFSVGALLLVVSLLAVSIGYVYQEMVKSSQMSYYQKMANTDLMTQLDSRTAFEERVRQFPILKGLSACIVLDINNLKQVNDTMGHSAGDELICTAAECILSVFDSLGRCYRMGGDEFVVLLQNMTESQVSKALSELELCISRRNLTRSFPLSLAVGYTMGQDATIEQMFREADANMYQNKSQMKCHAADL